MQIFTNGKHCLYSSFCDAPKKKSSGKNLIIVPL